MIQARQTPGKQDKEIDVDKNTAEDPKKVEAAHVMINGGDPTQWVTVNTDMGTRVGCEYETTTQNTKDIDAFTVHITPRAMLKRWDTGPPTADTDAFDKSWDTGQPPADIDAAQDAGTNTYTHTPGDGKPTHFTHTHGTYTYIQGARNAEGEPAHPQTRPQPNPDHPSFPHAPHQGRRACSLCSIGALHLIRNQTHIHRRAVGRHTRVESGS
jgi:hypothetical protein